MESAWTEYTRFVIGLAAIIDPLAAIPLFLRLTADFSTADRRRTARVTALAVGGLLMVAALTGEALLGLMGTSLAAFRVGGGIVMMLMAISMLMAQTNSMQHTDAEITVSESKAAIAVVPLGIPLLAGPGAISAVIIQMDRGAGFVHGLLVLLSIALVAGSCWITLRHAERVGSWVGPIGLNIIIRLFGLILAAIAVETIANGLRGLFPVLASGGPPGV